MKSSRAITVGVTFVAGLYFLLDFIVPPTLPGASVRGVVVSTTPASFSAGGNGASAATYTLAGQGNLRPQILTEERDVLGAPKLTPVFLRQVGVGSRVTIREGPFVAKAVRLGTETSVTTTEGVELALHGSQHWVDATSLARVDLPAPGMTLDIQQAAVITRVDPGAVRLIVDGHTITHRLGGKTVAIKLSRYGAGAEVQLDELRAGDTAQFGPGTMFADYRDTAAQFNLVITTMAFGIGLLSLGMVHGRQLVQRKKGWYVSAFFFAAVVLGLLAGIGKYQDSGTTGRAFSDFIVLRIIASATSTVFSLLAFYMAAAAYRAFRIRTAEAALMMSSALIVMLGQTPFGTYLTSWMGERYSALWLPNVAGWILRVPNTAVFRGLIFGIMLGAIATALRYWLSLDRGITPSE